MEPLNKTIACLIGLVVLVAVLQGCYYDTEAELYPFQGQCDTPDTVTYVADIQAIVATRCAVSGCHTGVNPTAGLRLDTYTQTQAIAASGKMSNRVLIARDMPPTGPLSACEQELIQAWINQGAPEF